MKIEKSSKQKNDQPTTKTPTYQQFNNKSYFTRFLCLQLITRSHLLNLCKENIIYYKHHLLYIQIFHTSSPFQVSKKRTHQDTIPHSTLVTRMWVSCENFSLRFNTFFNFFSFHSFSCYFFCNS